MQAYNEGVLQGRPVRDGDAADAELPGDLEEPPLHVLMYIYIYIYM